MSELILWKNQEMGKMRRDMERMFNRFWSDFGVCLFPGEVAEGPFIDLSETKDSLILRVELPGIDPEEVEISVTDRTLVIKGEKKEESVEKNAYYHRVERRFGSFSRSLQLPCKVEMDQIKAKYDKGVLKIVMPKCEPGQAGGRKVEVK